MEFLYPGFLYALAALAIPVIIHLFNFRRFKKIPFTNVRFLRDIKLQTQSHNRLRHLLTLLARMLALAFLVFAFAQPFIPNPNESGAGGNRLVSVFVDNSFSMEGESAAGTMIEVAKNRAIDIAMAYDASDRFQLLTHDFEGKHQRLVSRDVFIEWVQEVDLSPKSRSVDEVYSRQNELLNGSFESGNKAVYIVSDFQKNRFDFEALKGDSLAGISLVHLERNDPGNIYIDSVWFDSPVRKLNDAERLQIRVVNTGSNRIESIPVRLDVGGAQRALASVNVEGNSDAIATLEYVHETPGLQKAVVGIQDNPVTYDDTWYFSYDVFDQISILDLRPVSDTRNVVKAVFAGDSIYQYTSSTAGNIDYAALSQYQLVILSELDDISSGLASALSSFVANGGTIWMIPSTTADINSYNAFLAQVQAATFLPALEAELKVLKINVEHPLYRGVFENIPQNPDLPVVRRHLPQSKTAQSSSDVLMTLSNGSAFLSAFRPGRGQLYVMASSLQAEESNFSRHALFVATALRIAELSLSTAVRNIPLEDEAYFTVPAVQQLSESNLFLTDPAQNLEVIPLFRQREGQYFVTPGPEIKKAGNYALLQNGAEISAIGINYTRDESNLDSYTRSELEAVAANTTGLSIKVFDGGADNLSREVAQTNRGKTLWKICLLLALLFLLAESLLLRFWKTRTA